MNADLPSPPHWLPLAVADLAHRVSGRCVDGVVGGPGWLSLRVDADFIWFFAARGLRMLWRSSRPLPAPWLQALGRHPASGFATHLRGRRIDEVSLLVDSEGKELRIPHKDIVERVTLPESPMPAALETTLTAEEFNHLLRFLLDAKETLKPPPDQPITGEKKRA